MLAGVGRLRVEVTDDDVSEDEEAALLQVVDELDALARGSCIRHQEQHLRPPELDVVASAVQHQQVFAHLTREKTRVTETRFMTRNCRTA